MGIIERICSELGAYSKVRASRLIIHGTKGRRIKRKLGGRIARSCGVFRVSQKKVSDLIKASVKNRARINRKSSVNYSLIVNLKIDTLFVDIRTLREDIFVLKAQICLHLETRAFRFWPKLKRTVYARCLRAVFGNLLKDRHSVEILNKDQCA